MTAEPLRVLLVDDDEDDAFITQELLADAAEATGKRYHVDWVDTFQAGLDAALTVEYDVALVDYQLMPGSGLDLIQQAREAKCATPFILLTGMDEQAVDEQATDVGASDFLPKGKTDAALLERTIRYCVRHARTLASLAEKTRELERSNAELEQFARAVSHDLRQPLHAIAGYASLITMRFEHTLDDDVRGMLERILNGVERMSAMIEDLLELAQIDPQRESVVDVDCAALVSQVVEDLQPRIRAAGANISCETLPALQGRSAHLEQLFRNLLGNAIKFVGEEPPRVDVRCAAEGDGWHFEVCDNGIGVPDDQRKAIFLPFHRGAVSKKFEGTGVGLALCNKIVQQHGGDIWVEPAANGGSCFHFTLRQPI